MGKKAQKKVSDTKSEEKLKKNSIQEDSSTKEKKEKKKVSANEKLAKEKERKKNLMSFLTALDDNRKLIYGFIGGLVLGLLILVIVWPDRIATLEDGTQPVASIDGKIVTADELYEDMKEFYSVSLLLETIDKAILGEMYPEDDTMNSYVTSTAEYYYNSYSSYSGYTKEQFLAYYGFASEDDFLESLRLDYRRDLYTDDYIEGTLTDSEIEDYYNTKVYGDINCQHILVSTSDDLDEEAAKAKAQEIIDKLNNGTSWEDVQTEYADVITFEDLGYQAWDASLESSFLTALADLSDNSYSQSPVETSYGYHVIYRLDQKEAPTLDDEKEEIIDKLVSAKKSEDSNISYKALKVMREEANLEFSDSVMKKKYEEYCDQYK